MIIPNKFDGFYNGVRRCHGGGGGGGGGDGDAGIGSTAATAAADNSGNTNSNGAPPGDVSGGNDVYTPNYVAKTGNTGANTNFSNSGNTSIYSGPGVSTPQGMATLQAAKGTPYSQAGGYYNDLLNQGFTNSQIRTAAGDMYTAPSDASWGSMVQNAAMTSPTRRPMAGSDQFFQPVYQSGYKNYANPLTSFNVSAYGTTPTQSAASQYHQGQGFTNQQYMQKLRDQAPLAQNMNIGDLSAYMQQYGISPSDMQAASGSNTSAPQEYNPYAQTPYNPYTAGYGMGSGFLGANQGYGSGYGAQSPVNPYTNPFQYSQVQNPFASQQSSSSGYGGLASLMPQMQNPFMQPMQSQQTYPTQSNPYTTQPSQYNYQPSYSQQQYNPYQQYDQSLGSYNPYQMQSPFSYQQQPSYGGYGNYGRGNFIPDAPLSEGMMGTMGGTGYDPMTGRMDLGTAGGSGQYVARDLTPPPRSSGPTTPIVGRSSGFRGTPNVMRRAEGGIIDLMEKK